MIWFHLEFLIFPFLPNLVCSPFYKPISPTNNDSSKLEEVLAAILFYWGDISFVLSDSACNLCMTSREPGWATLHQCPPCRGRAPKANYVSFSLMSYSPICSVSGFPSIHFIASFLLSPAGSSTT